MIWDIFWGTNIIKIKAIQDGERSIFKICNFLSIYIWQNFVGNNIEEPHDG